MNKRNDILKLLAIITMTIDHIGLLFFPSLVIFRLLGRLAMPIFAYQLAIGYSKTRSKKAYAIRIGMFALIAQVPYMFLNSATSLDAYGLNILVLFLYSLLVLYLFDKFRETTTLAKLPLAIGFILSLAVPTFVEMLGINFSYSSYGIVMIFIFYIYKERTKENIILLSLFYLLLHLPHFFVGGIQIYALLALPLILWLSSYEFKFTLNKYVGYWFYPLHMAILILIKVLLF